MFDLIFVVLCLVVCLVVMYVLFVLLRYARLCCDGSRGETAYLDTRRRMVIGLPLKLLDFRPTNRL